MKKRKSISISGDTYARLTTYCESSKKTRSGVVESLLRDLLKDVPAAVEESAEDLEETAVSVPAALEQDQEPKKQGPNPADYFTF